MRNQWPRAAGIFTAAHGLFSAGVTMAKKLQFRRVIVLAAILMAAFAGLGYRLVDLQVVRHSELSAIAQQNTQREFLLNPRRGDILDVKGNLLATSAQVKNVCADPSLMSNYTAVIAHALAPILQFTENELLFQLKPGIITNARGDKIARQYVLLRKKVSLDTWERVQNAMLHLDFAVGDKKLTPREKQHFRDIKEKSVFPENCEQRVYPNQNLAAHVLGFASDLEREINGRTVYDIVGKEGIEYSFNSQLTGSRGWRFTETDRQKRELVTLREQDVEPRDGLNVVLTLDSVIQHIVESALADGMEKHTPISISGIVIRPRTGEILAMATLPNFDPNHPGNQADPRRNRVITDVVEPGSTFKIVVVSGALNDNVVRLTDNYDCEHGHFSFAGRVLHDHESYGTLSVEQIITKSSNIGAAKIGIKLGADPLYQYIRNFGFGTTTGVPLPGEARGRVYPVDKWSKVSIAQIPMGHGISVTRLQMIMAMSAIANQGVLMKPKLVARLEDSNHKVMVSYPPEKIRRVISETAAAQITTALKTVVATNGTAPQAALEHYTVAGKTGTAQKAENGFYVPGKYFSSFIGFFPADNPELCISVMMDEPKEGHYGGKVAAPIFKEIAERTANYLNIKPEDKEQLPVKEILPASDDHGSIKTAAARSQYNPN
jgi:cell division protein FtsI/penicillin-binding protein 2